MDDDKGKGAHDRRRKRSLVLLAAKVHVEGVTTDVRLRNLSQHGALLEADVVPPPNTRLTFERGSTIAEARVAWASPGRFGIEFMTPILESEVLVHIGGLKPSSVAGGPFRLLKK